MTLAQLRPVTAMVVPVWFPDSLSAEDIEAVLAPTLADVGPFAEPAHVLAVVDGAPKALQAAERLRARLGTFHILPRQRNEGKGGTVAAGIERLLLDPLVQYIVTRDHDNDHLANDAPNLIRLAARIREETGNDLVVTIGRRTSVHRHLGFVRGEYEWLMNEVVFEAVKFALAREGRVTDTRYFAAYEPVPDLQSGFKCYSRASAQLLIETFDRAAAGTPGLDLRRHGAEMPVLVETLLRGGVVGEITRLAWENQPLSTYDLAGRVQVKGTVLAWALHRTAVPGAVARQLLANGIARRLLAKEKDGLADLLQLANWTLEQLGRLRGEPVPPLTSVVFAPYF